MQYYNRQHYQYEQKHYQYEQNKLKKLKYSSADTAYGKDMICTKTNQIYTVKLKITKTPGFYIVIGIDEANQKRIDKKFYVQKDSLNYAYSSFKGKLWSQGEGTEWYGDEYKTGDIITMIVNTKDMNICWWRNNNKYEKIPIKSTNNKYRLAVCICYKGDEVELLEFPSAEEKKNEESLSFIELKTENEKLRNERDLTQSQNIKLKQEKEEYKNANLRQRDTIRLYESQIASLKIRNNELSSECNKLEEDNGKLLEEQKSMEIKIIDLENKNRELKLHLVDPSKYMEWQWEEILEWICSLEEGRFVKYSDTLKQSLKEEEVSGADIADVDILVIKGWGVINFKDKRDLLKHFKILTQKNQIGPIAQPALNEGHHDVPTAYI